MRFVRCRAGLEIDAQEPRVHLSRPSPSPAQFRIDMGATVSACVCIVNKFMMFPAVAVCRRMCFYDFVLVVGVALDGWVYSYIRFVACCFFFLLHFYYPSLRQKRKTNHHGHTHTRTMITHPPRSRRRYRCLRVLRVFCFIYTY